MKARIIISFLISIVVFIVAFAVLCGTVVYKILSIITYKML